MTTLTPEQQALADYQHLLRQTVAEALDTPSLYSNGTLYERDLETFALGKIGGQDCVKENFLGVIEAPYGQEGMQREKDYEERLRQESRGTWVIFHKGYENDSEKRDFYRPVMSKGGGEINYWYNTYDTPPTFDFARKRMVEHEVYDMRQTIQRERVRATNRAAVKDFGFTLGQTFKGLKFSGEKPFSTVTVTEIDAESGFVGFQAKRRGTTTYWKGSVEGRDMEASLKRAGYAPASMKSPEAALEWMGFALDYSDGILTGATRNGWYGPETYSLADNLAGMPKPAKELMIRAGVGYPTFTPAMAVRALGKTLENLQDEDVRRIFESYDPEKLDALALHILQGRPDLQDAVEQVRADLADDGPLFSPR